MFRWTMFEACSQLRGAGFVELELRRIDDDVRAGEVAHLVQLGGGPRGLNGATPSENHDLSDRPSR